MEYQKKRYTPSIELNNKFDEFLKDEENQISSNACSVMRYLISKANNKTGKAFPGSKSIAIYTRLSKASVFRALNELEKLRLIKRRRRCSTNKIGFKRNEYTFLVGKDSDEIEFWKVCLW